MLPFGAIDQTMRALGALAGSNRPLVRFMARYWWLTIPAGIAIGTQVWRRKKKGELTLHGVFNDAAPVIGLLAAVVTISEIARKSEAAPAGLQATAPGPVKDAEFTIDPNAQQTQAPA